MYPPDQRGQGGSQGAQNLKAHGTPYGLEGMLALKNFKRNKRRYRSIILSLTLSVVLTVTASSFGTYLNQIAENSAVAVEDYDICFYTRTWKKTSSSGFMKI